MPKVAKVLTALEVKRLTQPGHFAVGEVPGLYLQVTNTGARSWVLRLSIAGRRREMGLGGYPAVTLADARERARREREKVDSGMDPIHARRIARSALAVAQAHALTFEQCAERYIRTHAASWKNAKHAQQWGNTLAQYAYPVIGDTLVADVTKPQILQILEPIWLSKTETAARLRGRLEMVLSYAMQAGYRPEGLNPARWRGNLDKTLANPAKATKVRNHPALPADAIGTFMAELRQAEGMGARALEFTVLTAARSGEVRGALWSEIDLKAKVWTVPAERMKAGREHRVPLSNAAVALLKSVQALPRPSESDLVFFAPRGGVLSDMTLTAVTRRMGVAAVPHGFRSTFRDWVAERTNYPNEVAEMALAHSIADATEAAYRRGDLFDKRRQMMEAWAKFCATLPGQGEVVPFKRA